MEREPVIFVHGIAESSLCMLPFALFVQNSGYRSRFLDYPSAHYSAQEIAETYLHEKLQEFKKEKVIHFITHSMGGDILRHFLHGKEMHNLGRIVMLEPECKDQYYFDKCNPFYSTMLRSKQIQKVKNIKFQESKLSEDICMKTGVIMSSSLWNMPAQIFFRANEQKDTFSGNERAEDMKDAMFLPIDHDFMMYNPLAMYQTVYFLKNGHFNHTKIIKTPELKKYQNQKGLELNNSEMAHNPPEKEPELTKKSA